MSATSIVPAIKIEERNPFPGLRSFEPHEDHLFFGREKQVDELLERLNRCRFLAIVGTSGSGKSSLVRCGLVPSLHSGYMVGAGSSWRVAIFRPGEDPIGNLADALAEADVLGPEGTEPEAAAIHRELLEATLLSGELGLLEALRQARIPAEDNLLVIVDQFEELFRFRAGRKGRRAEEDSLAFVKLLLAATQREETPLYVAITMRSDFVGDCTRFPGLAEAINEGQYLVPRMVRDERRQAIAGPVAVGGSEINPRLLSRLLNEVGDNPDQLPILQHALMRTWADWDENHTNGEPLDLHHYEAIGTMTGALSQHAEEAFQELGERHRQIAEKVFKALTDKGTDARGIRSPRRLEELSELAEAERIEVRTVIECFRRPGRSFLMPPYPTPLERTSIIDISHESLMRNWERLIQWSDDEARSAQVYLRLAEAAKRYQESESGGLWTDPELESALNWREQTKPTAVWARRYDPAFERAMSFLDESRRERDRKVRDREERRRRQLTFAKRMALGAAAAALAFALLGLYAFDLRNQALLERQQAEEARQEAELRRQEAEKATAQAEKLRREAEEATHQAQEQRRQADEARDLADQQREKALKAKDEAEQERRNADKAKEQAIRQEKEAMRLKEEADENRKKAESQEKIAMRQRDKADRLSLLAGSRALAEQSMTLPKGDKELAALLAVEAYRLWVEAHSIEDSAHPHEGVERDAHVYHALVRAWQELAPDSTRMATQYEDAVRALVIGPDGRIVAGGEDGRIQLHDPQRPGRPGKVLQASGPAIRSLASDGSRLVAAGDLDGAVRLWSMDGSRRELVGQDKKAHDGAVYALAFTEAGLVSGGADGKVVTWKDDFSVGVRLFKWGFAIRAAAVGRDGHTLAVAHDRGEGREALRVWDLRQPEQEPIALELDDDVYSLAFHPDADRLAAGTRKGRVWIWDALDQAPQELAPHKSQVAAVAWSASGLLATASYDGNVRLWSLGAHRGGLEPVDLPHGAWMLAVALTPGGDRVVSGGADALIYARPTRMAELATSICRRAGRHLTAKEQLDHLPEDLDYRPTCPER